MARALSKISGAALLVILLGSLGSSARSDEDDAKDAAPGKPPVYAAVLYERGPEWDASKAFNEQPGIRDHVGHLARLKEEGYLLLGGPFLDGSGGLVVLRDVKLDRAKELAASDPAVKAGILRPIVRPWLVPIRAD